MQAATHRDASRSLCPTHFVEVGGRCLHFDFNNPGDWDSSREYCQAMNGDLVVVSDAQFFADVIEYINTLSGLDELIFWVGATRNEQKSTWMWVDGTPMKMGSPFWGYQYQMGYKQMPISDTARCVVMSHVYFFYFSETACTYDRYPICEAEAAI